MRIRHPRAQRIIIMGATSGIGMEAARYLIRFRPYTILGLAGRNEEALNELKELAPNRVHTQHIDVTNSHAPDALHLLIKKIGGMDVYLHTAGIGWVNTELIPELELKTMAVNGEGFVRMTTAAYNYMAAHRGGRLAAITSIAATRGLGAVPAYSATKAFQQKYLQALSQQSAIRHSRVRITDIRPGFVDTPLLKNRHFPMLMDAGQVARRMIHAIENGRRCITIDRRYAALVLGWSLIPGCIWEKLPVKP